MKREENNLDQLFRDGLRDYESPLSTNLWDKLDAAKEEEKKPKGIIWWKWGVGASLLTLFLATAFYIFNSQEKESNLPSVNTDVQSPITSIPKEKTNDQIINTIKDEALTLNNATVTKSTETNLNQNKASGSPVAAAKKVIRNIHSENFIDSNNSLENIDSNTDKPATFLVPAEINTIEKNINSGTTIITTSPEIQETKSTITQPIALEKQTKSTEKVKTTQRLNFLKTSAATLMDDAPDLAAAFAAPPIKIPFSWGPKGCYSFAGGRIKYDYYVDAFLAPEYVIRNLSAKTAEDESYRQRRDETEATLYGLSGGVRLSIVTRRGLALRTGIVYNRILERFKIEKAGDTLIVQVIQVGTMDTITTVETGTTVVRSYNRYHSIDIPLLLGYEIEAGKFNFSINAGAYFNIFARQKGKILSQSDTPEFITSNNPQKINAFEKDLGISIYGSVGLNYQVRSNLQLLIEPNLRYQLDPISLEAYPLEQHYVNIGLLLGVRRQF